MSLRQKVRLEMADGSEIFAVYDGRDLRRWEGENGKSALVEPMSVSMLTYLGWSAAKRDGAINGAYSQYKAFDKDCIDVRGVPDEDRPDPTQTTSPDTPETPSAE